MKKLTVITALALAAISLVSTSASAQTVTTGVDDLILGFRIQDTAGTGANTNLEVDLGAVSTFTTTYAGTLSGATGLAVADLVSTYGSNWATRTDLVWGAAGAISGNSFDLTLNSTTGVHTGNNATLSTPAGFIDALAPTLNGLASTSNSANSATIGDNTAGNHALDNSGSYSNGISSGNTGAYDYTNYAAGITEFGLSTDPVGSLSLYSFTPGTNSTPPVKIGTFTLGSDGTFNFVGTAAVPEPSSYAMGLCAMLLIWVLRRRNSIV